MTVQLSPDCRDDNHGKCPGYGWDLDADQADACPCTCHPETVKCGLPHEAPGLAYLGPCLMGANHDGPHEFDGPIEGTVISVTLGDGWTRTRTEDRPEHLLEPGLKDVLEGLGRALGSKARGPEEPPEAVAVAVGHWRTTYDPNDGEPIGEVCHCTIGADHDGTGKVNEL